MASQSLVVPNIAPTVSEEEQQGLKVSHGDLSGLPRSVRWRIQLGLLQEPATTSISDTGSYYDCCCCTLEEVTECNLDRTTQQNRYFKELVEKYLEEEQEQEQTVDAKEGTTTSSVTTPSDDCLAEENKTTILDPLTAIVMEQQAQETRKAELYLKYRKERARKKRGLSVETRVIESESSDEVDRASLVIIEKDLKRLPHPRDEKHLSGAVSTSNNNTLENEARITSLREILYIYAQEHPDIGYRQGMHEIASYLLFVLELEHDQFPDHPLFNPILPTCYALLQRTLEHLKTAYDATGGKSLQQMSIAILGKILQNDPTLYHHLTSNPNIPPPPIYCTRWVRLMFSREVVGYENVFQLWDVFFSYANVMQAVEMTSASRILLMGDALLTPDSNTLDLLMNVPPLTDVSPLTDILQRLMQQKEGDQAVTVPHMLTSTVQQMHPPPDHLPIQQQSQLSIPQISPPMPMSTHQMYHPMEPQTTMTTTTTGDFKFSFSKMRQSLGQRVDSLGQKIATKTNEWTEAARRDMSGGGSFSAPGSSTSHSFDPLAGLHTHAYSNPQPSTAPSSNKVNWNTSLSSTIRGSTPNVFVHSQQPQEPNTPRQHQHEMWSKMLQQKIMTVQEFLMALESKENAEGRVPPDVWEALADMDRMQRELLNYSRNII